MKLADDQFTPTLKHLINVINAQKELNHYLDKGSQAIVALCVSFLKRIEDVDALIDPADSKTKEFYGYVKAIASMFEEEQNEHI